MAIVPIAIGTVKGCMRGNIFANSPNKNPPTRRTNGKMYNSISANLQKVTTFKENYLQKVTCFGLKLLQKVTIFVS